MNERIKELAEQVYGSAHHDDFKFAELIVRECVGIVENLSPGYDDYRNQIEDAFRRDCVEKVKEHFGVDE